MSLKQILFVELLGGIGDVLIALAAIQALSRSHPHAKLTVLTFAPGGELLKTDPLIHQVVVAQKGEAKQAISSSYQEVANLLCHQKFDLIVSDTKYDGIDQLIHSSDAQCITNLWRSPPSNQFVSDRFLEILRFENLITQESIQPARLHLLETERQTAFEQLGNIERPIVVLYTDAGMQIKRWPTQRFVELGRRLKQQFGGTIVLPIGANLTEVTEIGKSDDMTVWPQGTLRDFAAMMSWVDLTIAPDTGPARISAALGIPTITLFGPSWHQRYGQPTPHQNLQGYLDCPERVIQNFTEQRCWYGGVCPFEQWNTCLEGISVDQVMTSAIELLQAQKDNVLK
ncbi:glycosyltransferase family 9 protein [Phormidesmis sp. 146-33]